MRRRGGDLTSTSTEHEGGAPRLAIRTRAVQANRSLLGAATVGVGLVESQVDLDPRGGHGPSGGGLRADGGVRPEMVFTPMFTLREIKVRLFPSINPAQGAVVHGP